MNTVCLCSRGLVHSRTLEAVDSNLEQAIQADSPWRREKVWTHDLPIPEAQNVVVERARKYSPEWLWFVEEDIVPPPGLLLRLMELGEESRVVAARYKLKGGLWCEGGTRANTPTFAGLGCVLIHLSVFDEIGYPYFRSDITFSEDLCAPFEDKQVAYGRHDIYFYSRLKNERIGFSLAPVECQHLEVVEYGEVLTNNGFHTVRALS